MGTHIRSEGPILGLRGFVLGLRGPSQSYEGPPKALERPSKALEGPFQALRAPQTWQAISGLTRDRLDYFRTHDRLGGQNDPLYLQNQLSDRDARGGVWKLWEASKAYLTLLS